MGGWHDRLDGSYVELLGNGMGNLVLAPDNSWSRISILYFHDSNALHKKIHKSFGSCPNEAGQRGDHSRRVREDKEDSSGFEVNNLSYNRNMMIGFIVVAIGLAGILYYNLFTTREVSIERAEDIAEKYLDSINDADIAIGEIMEFEYNHYVVYYEKSTEIGAFEMLIDKQSGRIFPEYGPNMMWNTKYGHGGMMGGPRGIMGWLPQSPSGDIFDEEEALEIAQAFLDDVYPGSVADDPHPFYGYYTIHTTRDREIFGMLSVNQYTGAVWYHNWHGEYVKSIEEH